MRWIFAESDSGQGWLSAQSAVLSEDGRGERNSKNLLVAKRGWLPRQAEHLRIRKGDKFYLEKEEAGWIYGQLTSGLARSSFFKSSRALRCTWLVCGGGAQKASAARRTYARRLGVPSLELWGLRACRSTWESFRPAAAGISGGAARPPRGLELCARGGGLWLAGVESHSFGA